MSDGGNFQYMFEISCAGNSFAPQGTGNDSCGLKIDLLSSCLKYHLYIIYNFINSLKSPLSLELLSKYLLIRNIYCTVFVRERMIKVL